MSISITAKGSNTASAGGISLTTTAGTSAGDILFFILGKDDDTKTTTRPSGFTVLKEGILASGGIYCEVYYKVITSTESSQTYTWVGDSETYSVGAFSLHSTLGDLSSPPLGYGLSEGNSTQALCPDPGDHQLGFLINGFVCDQDESPFTKDPRSNKLYELIETGSGGHCNGIYYTAFPSGKNYIAPSWSPTYDSTNAYGGRNFGYSTGISSSGLEMIGLARPDNSITSFTRADKDSEWTYRNELSISKSLRYSIHMDGTGKVLAIAWDDTGRYLATYYRSTFASTWTLQETLGPFDGLETYKLTDNGLCLVLSYNTGTYQGFRTYTRTTLTASWSQQGSDYTPTQNIPNGEGLKGLSRDGLVVVCENYCYKRTSITSAWTYVGANNVTIESGDMDDTGLVILHRLTDTSKVYRSARTSVSSATWTVTTYSISNTSGILTAPSMPKDEDGFLVGFPFGDDTYTNEGNFYTYIDLNTSYQALHVLNGANDWLTYSIWVGDLTVFTHDPTGGAVVSGAALTNRVYGAIGSGGVVVESGAAFETTKDFLPIGGVVSGGAADTAYVPGGNNVYEHFPTGGAVVSGTAQINVLWDYQVSGGAVVSGIAPVNMIRDYIQSGEIVVSGIAVTFPPVPYAELITTTTKGDLTFSSTGALSYVYNSTPPGGYTPPPGYPNAIDEDSFTYRIVDKVGVSQEVTDYIYLDAVIKTYPVIGSGGAVVSGEALTTPIILNVYNVIGTGKVFVYGATDTAPVKYWEGTGGVIVSGAAYRVTFKHVPYVSGGVVVSGVAAINQARDWYHIGSGIVVTGGNAVFAYVPAAVTTFSYTGAGTAIVSGQATSTKLNAFQHIGSGGVIVQGQGLISRGYGVNPGGGVEISGTAESAYVPGPVNTFEHIGSGSVYLSGEALLNRIYGVTGSDGAIVSGSAEFQKAYDHVAKGNIVVSGNPVIDKVDSRYPFNIFEYDTNIEQVLNFDMQVSISVTKSSIIETIIDSDISISTLQSRVVNINEVLNDNYEQKKILEYDIFIQTLKNGQINIIKNMANNALIKKQTIEKPVIIRVNDNSVDIKTIRKTGVNV